MNSSRRDMRTAVGERNAVASATRIEASGGIDLANIRYHRRHRH